MVSSAVVWSEELLSYDFGAGHPMAPVRMALTHQLMQALGVLDLPGVRVVPAPVATDEELTAVHTPDYVAAVRRAQTEEVVDHSRGLGDEDNPLFGTVHTASARIVGASLAAAREVWSGRADRALNLAGGMHHAMAGRASGFCVYNDPAVAIAWLLGQGARRVAYVDLDAHHGDGVERAFWDDDRVLTISVHQHPGSLFPGTGYAQDVGGAGARGTAVNVPLLPGTTDAAWLRVLDAVVEPLVAAWAPDILVTQHGCDSHQRDPLAGLDVSVDAHRAAALMMAELAESHCHGRWVATGGGGYEVVGVVPRSWTHLAAVLAGRPLAPDTPVPEEWARAVQELADVGAPELMTDGRPGTFRPVAQGINPDDGVDRAIMATRNAVFPSHGLDPWAF
ncbi:acetoin utilization protein AcuC [Georgenia sp. 10Sc9-8]|uniref:Acetoin utilization protein AcuC n=1 Tax=Georgenia halotolerans TaxID=3028317 RepID=A0ABT5TZW2_9MICO|nr:acetoin utilization protein AcuC [Georgenia halotolerans]